MTFANAVAEAANVNVSMVKIINVMPTPASRRSLHATHKSITLRIIVYDAHSINEPILRAYAVAGLLSSDTEKMQHTNRSSVSIYWEHAHELSVSD